MMTCDHCLHCFLCSTITTQFNRHILSHLIISRYGMGMEHRLNHNHDNC